MAMPPLLRLPNENAYFRHFKKTYCSNGPIITHDGIPVEFRPSDFNHAFYDSIHEKDDTFSVERARRMDWIKPTLQDAKAQMYCGWIKKKGKYDPRRRVAYRFDNFVVVIFLRTTKSNKLKGSLITCYNADDSTISKIVKSPKWTKSIYKKLTAD